MMLGWYALFLLAFIIGLLVLDWARFGRTLRRIFWFELIVFCAGGLFVVLPDVAQQLANTFGIGRGVDFVLYPLLVWLVRESIVSRYSRWEDQRRLAELIRRLALKDAQTLDAPTSRASD